jgi:hypothetical protein
MNPDLDAHLLGALASLLLLGDHDALANERIDLLARCRGGKRRQRSERRDGGKAGVELRHLHPPHDGQRLERDDFSSNRHPAPASCLSIIFFRKVVPTFRDHALARWALPLVSGGSKTHAIAFTSR